MVKKVILVRLVLEKTIIFAHKVEVTVVYTDPETNGAGSSLIEASG